MVLPGERRARCGSLCVKGERKKMPGVLLSFAGCLFSFIWENVVHCSPI